MNTEAHLAVGWLLAHTVGREDRRFRALVVVAALAPDLDAVTYLGGADSYARWHHILGHNVFFGLAVSIVSMALFRRDVRSMLKILLFTQLAFHLHWLGDLAMSGWPITYFWPFTDEMVRWRHSAPLDHWTNHLAGYASFLSFVVIAIICRRTPLELLSPRLDGRIVKLFERKTEHCHICSGAANERCNDCRRFVCLRHARLTRRFMVRCTDCHNHSTQSDSSTRAVDR